MHELVIKGLSRSFRGGGRIQQVLDGLAGVAGLTIDSSALRRAADSSRRQVDQLISDNEEHQAMVRKLEENIDASEGNAMGVDAVPSGDEIAAELERFLR